MLVKNLFESPSLIRNEKLVTFYKSVVKPIALRKSLKQKNDAGHEQTSFDDRIEQARNQDNYFGAQDETGFGNENLEVEVGRDKEVMDGFSAPWANTPSISRQSGASVSGGDAFSFERIRELAIISKC